MGIRRMVALGAMSLAAVAMSGMSSEALAAKKKAKGQRAPAVSGAAGAVSSAKTTTFRPRAIDSDAFQGVYCTGTTPIVHQLGTLPPDAGVIIDFESDENADPIAVLAAIKTNGLEVGVESTSSDDEGGDLNPRFDVRRPYRATYVLTVASADEDEACYAFRVRVSF